MQKNLALGCIIFIGLAVSLLVGVLNKKLTLTSFSQYRDDSQYYNEKAFTLLDQGSLRDDLSEFRKPPLYSVFLAVSYSVLGRRPLSAWIMQAVLFAISIMVLYAICKRYFDDNFMYMPPLLLALYWANAFYVFKIGSEMLAITLLLLVVYFMLKYFETQSWKYLALFAFSLSAFILTKPVLLYAVPLLFILIIYEMRHKLNNVRILRDVVIAFTIVFIVVGGWMIRNYIKFHDYQIEQTGHIIWIRGRIAEASYSRIGAYWTASLLGDYVADLAFSGYAQSPLPLAANRDGMRVWIEKKKAGDSPLTINSFFLIDGLEKIRKNLGGIFLTSIPGFFELNAPTNHKGFSLAHFLTDTHPELSSGVRLTIILSIRFFWFVFLYFVIISGLRAYRSDIKWRSILFFIIYFNIIHALVIVPAETRYIAPIMPFYFLLATVEVRRFLTRGGCFFSFLCNNSPRGLAR